MHLNAKKPVFVPREHWDEIEKLSKAALMDLVWDLCITTAAGGGDEKILDEFRNRREIILAYRNGGYGHDV